MTELNCFKAYDIRGEIGVNIDNNICYRIGRAVAQHFRAKSVIVGYDARETSPDYADSVSLGIKDAGSDVLKLGLAGTEEMYWAVTEYGACAGIEITASHNPINYNGMKIVRSYSRPLDTFSDFQQIKSLAETEVWVQPDKKGSSKVLSAEARVAYVNQVLSFIDTGELMPLKIVVNCGNGAAGPTFDAIAERLFELNTRLDFVRIHHVPDSTFPNGIPNPLLPRNHVVTARKVVSSRADFGIAFDGDFDRCFFFDENGGFVPSEYIVGLIASIFLKKEKGATIVHDPRTVWNTCDVIKEMGGVAVQSKTGHAFVKEKMREKNAIYGGEISAHHYFRDFAYCDSGMIPWLLIAEHLSSTGQKLGKQLKPRMEAFPSSGELNFVVDNVDKAILNVLDYYKNKAIAIDETDGVSLIFENWRFNLRASNTEPLIRLNVESEKDPILIKNCAQNIAEKLDGKRV